MAAGLTIERANLGAVRAFFEEAARDTVGSLTANRVLKIDGALGASAASFDFCDQLESAGPYGSGHSQPIFALPMHRITDSRFVGTNHIKVMLEGPDGGRVEGMAFRAGETDLGKFLLASRGDQIHVAGTMSADFWQGTRRIQFRILDAARASFIR
jgi:single-stranded-DNA-specific exonuclease